MRSIHQMIELRSKLKEAIKKEQKKVRVKLVCSGPPQAIEREGNEN